jgi:ATP-dependent DNA helicase RecQ
MILNVAKNLLSLNQSRFPLPDLKANRQPVTTHNYCEIIDVSKNIINWKEKLKELIEFESRGNKYTQIAVMFRSNNEVFRAFNEIKNLNIPDVRIRIQGSGGSLFKSREFHYLISILKGKENSVLTDNFLNEIKTLKFKTVSKFPRWDKYLLNIFHCLAFEYNKERDENSTYLDFILFVKDIASNDDGQYGKIYQQNISQITNEGTKDQEIVITTMHKVKGLEFDAVLIPPSFTDLPAFENSATLQENIEEERRLYYVAYTRARYRLVVFLFQRENAMLAGDKYTIPDSQKLRLGIPFRDGWDKFTMFWSASDYGYNSFEILRDSVSIGDQLVLQLESRGGYSFWYVLIGNKKVAQLSIQMKNHINNFYYNQNLNMPHRIQGFSVSSIEVHSYEETVESDSNNKTEFAARWNSTARERGHIYIVDFSGYGKPITI